MDPLHVIAQPIKQWRHAYLPDCSGALFHFVVSQIIQEPNRAGFDSRKNITQSGCAACRMQDGRYYEMNAGDLFYIGPGHDSWVVGNEPYVSLHFLGAEFYAQPHR